LLKETVLAFELITDSSQMFYPLCHAVPIDFDVGFV